MTTIGDTTYPIIISTTEAAGAPTGDLIYLLADSFTGSDQPLTRTKHFYKGKAYKFQFGKKIQKASINNALVLNTNLNDVKTLLRKSTRYGGTQLYFWAILATGVYYKWEKPYVNATIDEVNYLYGWIENGPVFTAPSISSKYWKLTISFEDGWES